MITHLLACLVLMPAVACHAGDDDSRWYRGNTHTHTLWSDGDAPPEHAVKWYVDNDYDFLVLSDHNVMQQGERWFAITPDGRLDPTKIDALETTFGPDWVETRQVEDATEMRLRTLAELKTRFEAKGDFLLIPGEEVTDRYRLAEVHINALNLERTIDPQHGDSVEETIQNNLDAIAAQGVETGRSVLAHLNHPNFRGSLGVENLANMKGERFFEVYNGHRSVDNEGASAKHSTETLWDLALTRRLRDGAGDGAILFGLATDDAHDHYERDAVSVPGRGWIMVRSNSLQADAIVDAMKRGDFYASSGVFLEDIVVADDTMKITIKADPGVTYTTEFIGIMGSDDPETTKPRVLASTTANPAVHRLSGDELYVRARVVSDRPHPKPYAKGDFEQAWIQPVTVQGQP